MYASRIYGAPRVCGLLWSEPILRVRQGGEYRRKDKETRLRRKDQGEKREERRKRKEEQKRGKEEMIYLELWVIGYILFLGRGRMKRQRRSER